MAQAGSIKGAGQALEKFCRIVGCIARERGLAKMGAGREKENDVRAVHYWNTGAWPRLFLGS